MYLYLLQVKMKFLYAYVEGKWPRIILFFDGISYGSTSCTLNCVSIFLIFLNNLYLIKMYISVEKSINKNTRGNFSQDCRIQSYTLLLWRSVDIIKNGYWFFLFQNLHFIWNPNISRCFNTITEDYRCFNYSLSNKNV